jgi:hypothetical protein
MGYRHELCHSRSAKDGMVKSFEVRDHELDVLGAVILPSLSKVTGRIT